jgi:hypothetical protein
MNELFKAVSAASCSNGQCDGSNTRCRQGELKEMLALLVVVAAVVAVLLDAFTFIFAPAEAERRI